MAITGKALFNRLAPSRPQPLRRSLLLTACVATLLALHFWLGVSATFEKSVTFDETAHLTAGYTYWRFDDYRLQPENGNLPQRWAALPLLWQDPHVDTTESHLWTVSDIWRLSNGFFFRWGNNIDFMLATGRAATAFWSVATGLLVFIWSRRLWGDGGGLFSLILFTFSATTLAHGPLVTSDMCVTFFLLAACGAYWRHLEDGNSRTLLLSITATSLATVAKFSFLLLPFVFALMAVCRLLERSPLKINFRGRSWQAITISHKAAWLAGSTMLHLGAAWLVIWTFLGWKYLPAAEELPAMNKYYIPWQVLLPENGLIRWAIDHARAWHVLPEAYIQGFTYVLSASQARGAFLNGTYSNAGWWWFFPYAYLIKTPIAELLTVTTVGWLALFRWIRSGAVPRLARVWQDFRPILPLLALLLIYGGFSVLSHLNIGHRHILVLYPLLMILGGALISRSRALWRKAFVVLLMMIAIGESYWIRPHYLAYFNCLVGGPAQGWKHLVDSSLDWGQDLPRLAQWLNLNQRPNDKVYLSTFGNSSYEHEGIRGEVLSPYHEFLPRHWIELKPGLYCISATMLQDVYSPWRGFWQASYEHDYQVVGRALHEPLAKGTISPVVSSMDEPGINLFSLDRLRFARLTTYLRLKPPAAIIGYSIFVFRLSETEIHTATLGSTKEYVDLLNKSMDATSSNKP